MKTVTLLFMGLTSGRSVNNYTEQDFTLSGDGIQAGIVCVPNATAASLYNGAFTLKETNGLPFGLDSLMLTVINQNISPQTLTFTGNLAKSETVNHELTTNGQNPCDAYQGAGPGWETYKFPSNFTNLNSIVWDPKTTMVTNVVLSLDP